MPARTAIEPFTPRSASELLEKGADYAALFDYWQSLRGAEALPDWRRFDPIQMPKHLSRLWAIEVHEPFRLRYRVVGTHISASYGRDPTGRWVDEVWPHFGQQQGGRYREAILRAEPAFRRGKPRMMVQREWGMIENLVLPFRLEGLFGLVLGYSHLYDADGQQIY